MSRTATAVAVAALAALGLAGCGSCSGDDEASASAQRAYARQVDRYCGDVRTATVAFQRSADALRSSPTPATVARRFGAALDELADGFAMGSGRLRAADPPDPYRSFNTRAIDALDAATTRLRRVGRTARSGDVDALGTLGSQLGDLRVPDAPQQLLADAPRCRGASAGSSG